LLQVTNMYILLHVIDNHHVAYTHCVASFVIMILFIHVFCFLYFAACQSYLCCNYINVFCFMLSVIIMLFVIIRLHHLNHDITHIYILLFIFCFLCFLYSASCILLLINHINVFCFMLFIIIILSVIIMLFVIIMLSVITKSYHFNHNVTHMYILLLIFCFLYSASCILLFMFCFLYFASCILLLVFCFLCFASYVLLLVFCFLCFASYVLLLVFCFLYSAFCILLLMFYFLYSASCILLLVFCFLYSAACHSYSRCNHTDMCILLCVTRSHYVVCTHSVMSLVVMMFHHSFHAFAHIQCVTQY